MIFAAPVNQLRYSLLKLLIIVINRRLALHVTACLFLQRIVQVNIKYVQKISLTKNVSMLPSDGSLPAQQIDIEIN